MMKRQAKEDESNNQDTEIFDKDLKKISDETNDFSIHENENKGTVQKKIQ